LRRTFPSLPIVDPSEFLYEAMWLHRCGVPCCRILWNISHTCDNNYLNKYKKCCLKMFRKFAYFNCISSWAAISALCLKVFACFRWKNGRR
jgi:hypothetical protein